VGKSSYSKFMAAIATIVAAVLALSGVIAGIVVAPRRWQAERRDTRRAQFTKDRQSAYRRMWESVEELDIDLRSSDLSPIEIAAKVRDINVRLIKCRLYIDDADRELIASYVKALGDYQRLIMSSNDSAAKEEFEMTATGLTPSLRLRVQEMYYAQEDLGATRARIIARIRLVLIDAEGVDPDDTLRQRL